MEDPIKNLGNDPPKTRLLMGSLSLFDINILPERYRRRKIRFIGLLPWLIFLLLLAALYPTGLMALESQAVLREKQSAFNEIQSEVENFQVASDRLDALQANIDSQTELRDQIINSYQGLELNGSIWHSTFINLEAAAPDGISWKQISRQENELFINGIANNYSVVISLVDALDNLEELRDVRITTVDQIQVEEDQPTDLESGEDPAALPTLTPSFSFTIQALVAEEGEQ
jgi:Tfp pilus assembly protein PilN